MTIHCYYYTCKSQPVFIPADQKESNFYSIGDYLYYLSPRSTLWSMECISVWNYFFLLGNYIFPMNHSGTSEILQRPVKDLTLAHFGVLKWSSWAWSPGCMTEGQYQLRTSSEFHHENFIHFLDVFIFLPYLRGPRPSRFPCSSVYSLGLD